MRRRLLRKKRKVILWCLPFLLVGGGALFRIFETERDIFIQTTHALVEKRLSEASGLRASLGSVRVGTFQNIFLEGLTLRHPGAGPVFTIPRAHLSRGREPTKITFRDGEFLWGGVRVRHLRGELLLGSEKEKTKGAMGLERLAVKGNFQKNGRLEMTLHRRNVLAYEGKIRLENFMWGERDLSGLGEILFLVRDPWQDFKVKTVWHRLFLEDRPLEDVFGRLTLTRESLFVEHIQWGESLRFFGRTRRSFPYETEGRLRFQRVDREKLKVFLKDPSRNVPKSIEGWLLFHGPLKKIHVSGHLVAYDGRLKDIDYETVNSALHGHWPVITVESRIARKYPEESSLTVLGLVDLAELGQKGFYKTVALEGSDAVVWKGVVLQNPSRETLVFGKGDGTTSVSLRTYLNQSLPQEEEEEEFELQYRLREDKAFKVRLKGTEEFLGLEHKTSF